MCVQGAQRLAQQEPTAAPTRLALARAAAPRADAAEGSPPALALLFPRPAQLLALLIQRHQQRVRYPQPQPQQEQESQPQPQHQREQRVVGQRQRVSE